MITLSWTPVTGATAYRVYRGTATGAQAPAQLGPDVTTSAFVDSAVDQRHDLLLQGDGRAQRRRERALDRGECDAGRRRRAPSDPTTLSTFRLLRQSTWGPRPATWTASRRWARPRSSTSSSARRPSVYPDTLYDKSVEAAQEHFMSLALTGPDQLRQRVAWALHKIWVVSAVEIHNSRAIVPYYRILMNGAFGNYRDLMRAVTLNPAMGRYLNMLNNRSQAVTGVAANENYPRELMQLFTLGTAKLNPDGTPMIDGRRAAPDLHRGRRQGTGADLHRLDLRRRQPGHDSHQARVARTTACRWSWWSAYHDRTAKTFLGEDFDRRTSTPTTELNHALDIIFNHPNVAPFVSRQLIQQLVTSNPSPRLRGRHRGGVRRAGIAVARRPGRGGARHPDCTRKPRR